MFDVYITKSGKYLPNSPVSNDEMEAYLGLVNGTGGKGRKIVLRNSRIENRYYALDKEGNSTHSNAALTSAAVSQLFDSSFSSTDMELLSCGTSTPDQMLPSHAAMVHGLLGNKSIELNSSTGICCAGMNALKFGYLSVRSGNTNNAVCTGSERVSSWLKSEKYQAEAEHLSLLEHQPIIAFKKEFLRWMLSDGAGAFLLERVPRGEVSLKIEWMDAYSYAHELETCMYAGGEKSENGEIVSWSDYSPDQWLQESIFSIKQDIKLLDKYILVKGVESFRDTLRKHQITCDLIDWFLPHVSSFYFADKLKDALAEAGFDISEDKWFLNLNRLGNVGSASIYLALEELMNSGKLRKGDRIFLSVPESGRFSYAYAYLTVV